MNNGIKITFCFVTGVGIGALAGKLYYQKKYMKLANEEIKITREYYLEKAAKYKKNLEESKTVAEPTVREVIVQDKDDLPDCGWKRSNGELYDEVPDYRNLVKNISEPRKPYVISPEEFFNDETDFEKITLEYYAKDHILADDKEMLEDIESTVGTDWENGFGEYVASTVYIRNEFQHCDYEILYVPDAFTSDNRE